MNKQITTLLGVGLALVVAFMLFRPKKAKATTTTASADDSGEDSEDFYGVIQKRATATAIGKKKGGAISDDLNDEAESVENIGIKKAKVKRGMGGSLKRRIVDAVVTELGVNPKEAVMLIRNRDEQVTPILARFRGDLKKQGRAKRGTSTAVGLQTTEESQFAFNSMDEID